MHPDEMSVRPVVHGSLIRPVHRDSPSRDSTARQQSQTPEPAEPEQTKAPDENIPPSEEQTHLIDLSV